MNNKNKKPNIKRTIFLYTKLINILVVFTLFIGMFVYALFFSRVTESDYDKDLKSLPELTSVKLFSGEFFHGITDYYTDTIHGRDRFKDMGAFIRSYYGVAEKEQEFGNTTPPQQQPSISDDESGSDSDDPSQDISSETSTDISEPEQKEEICEGIVILGTRAMELYYGNIKNAEKYAEYVNAYATQLGSGVNVYSMVIPKSCAYYIHGSKKHPDVWKYTVDNLTAIKDSLNGVKNVDVYNALLPHVSEEIYFRTDHHWTGLGAFYSAKAFAEIAGVPFADLSSYDIKVRSGYLGTMLKYTNYNATLQKNPEDFVTYIPRGSYTATFYNQRFENGFEHDIYFNVGDDRKSSWYLTYLSGDSYTVKIKSHECNNGRKLVIFKDSYGNSLSPYFLESFEEVYIIDIREFKLNAIDFIEENEITDVLFAVSAFSATGASVNKYIETIRLQ